MTPLRLRKEIFHIGKGVQIISLSCEVLSMWHQSFPSYFFETLGDRLSGTEVHEGFGSPTDYINIFMDTIVARHSMVNGD